MEQELEARTRELSRTQEDLMISNQMSSDLSQKLEELQRHYSALEEQRFLLGLWGPWEEVFSVALSVTCPPVPIAHHNTFWSQGQQIPLDLSFPA